MSYTFTAGYPTQSFHKSSSYSAIEAKAFCGYGSVLLMPCGVLKLQPKLEFYNMNVFKCFAYPVWRFTVQGFTCLQIKRGNTGPKSRFFSFFRFEKLLQRKCTCVGLQDVRDFFLRTMEKKKNQHEIQNTISQKLLKHFIQSFSHSFRNTSSTAHL